MANFSTWQPQYEVSFITSDKGLFSFTSNITEININTTTKEMINTFQVVLEPRDYDSNGSTLYDVIEPMTYCVIKLQRVNNQLTTVIRGFVTEISKNFDLSSDAPKRTITISGENYGKIIKDTFITYILGLDNAQLLIGSTTSVPLIFGFGQNKGIDVFTGGQGSKPSIVIYSVFNTLVTPNFEAVKTYIQDRQGVAGSTATQTSTAGQIAAQQIDNFVCSLDTADTDISKSSIDVDGVDGIRNGTDLRLVDPTAGSQATSIYALFESWAGKPWNEMYVDDRDEGAYFVFRAAPYRDRYQDFLSTSSYDGGYQPINISEDEVISFNLRRSDAQVFNYFFTDLTYTSPTENFESIMMANPNSGNPIFVAGVVDYTSSLGSSTQNTGTTSSFVPTQMNEIDYSRIEIYGYRPLKLPFRFLTGDINNPALQNQAIIMNEWLFNAFEQNSQYEEGTITIRGREDIRPGMYVTCITDRYRNDKNWYYVESLQHNVQPISGNFLTTLNVTRGEGHLNYNPTSS